MSSSKNNTLNFSAAGSAIAGGGTTITGKFGAIQFLTDGTIDSFTATNIDTSAATIATSFGAGTIIYGNFTSVAVSGGVAALHKI